MTVRCLRLSVVLWLCLAAAARAGELLVDAPVVNVVPLGDEGPMEDSAVACAPARPAPGAGLVALLEWDLRAHCPDAAGRVTGYRVYYRWDGRTYDRVVAEPPGETVALRVRVR